MFSKVVWCRFVETRLQLGKGKTPYLWYILSQSVWWLLTLRLEFLALTDTSCLNNWFYLSYVFFFTLFPHTTVLQQTTLKSSRQKNGNSINENNFIKKSWKHLGKWRNCSLQAISPFIIMLSKGVCCKLVKMCL